MTFFYKEKLIYCDGKGSLKIDNEESRDSYKNDVSYYNKHTFHLMAEKNISYEISQYCIKATVNSTSKPQLDDYISILSYKDVRIECTRQRLSSKKVDIKKSMLLDNIIICIDDEIQNIEIKSYYT